MHRTLPALAALALLLTGCTAAPVPAPTPTPTAQASDPAGLIGMWRVSDAKDADADTWLRLDALGVTVIRPCGQGWGDWRALGDQFVASVMLFDGSECIDADTSNAHLDWLNGARGFRELGDGWQLTDSAGAALATLRVDGMPAPTSTLNGHPDASTVPSPSPEDLAGLVASSLPHGLVAEPSLAGEWQVVGHPESRAGVELAANGDYRSSDGCNQGYGRWLEDGTGTLLATVSGRSQVGCENIPVPNWINNVATAGWDDDELVLVDRAGEELGRLERR